MLLSVVLVCNAFWFLFHERQCSELQNKILLPPVDKVTAIGLRKVTVSVTMVEVAMITKDHLNWYRDSLRSKTGSVLGLKGEEVYLHLLGM